MEKGIYKLKQFIKIHVIDYQQIMRLKLTNNNGIIGKFAVVLYILVSKSVFTYILLCVNL